MKPQTSKNLTLAGTLSPSARLKFSSNQISQANTGILKEQHQFITGTGPLSSTNKNSTRFNASAAAASANKSPPLIHSTISSQSASHQPYHHQSASHDFPASPPQLKNLPQKSSTPTIGSQSSNLKTSAAYNKRFLNKTPYPTTFSNQKSQNYLSESRPTTDLGHKNPNYFEQSVAQVPPLSSGKQKEKKAVPGLQLGDFVNAAEEYKNYKN